LVVMEAMKMENELRVQVAGRVRTVLVAPGSVVEKGALLIELD
jgi:biotin carboxyl carrier protein